jgi:hypothetical protein
VSWLQLLSRSLSSPPGPCSTLLSPPLDSSPHRASLHHWLKTCSSALCSPDCFLVDQQRIHPLMLITRADDQELLLSLGKLDDPVWHFGLSSFPALRPSYPIGGRRICNNHLLSSSPRAQNPQQVLTIPGGSESVVVPMVRTTPPKEDNVDTSSVKVPRPRYWRPDRKVRRQMTILLTMIPTF